MAKKTIRVGVVGVGAVAQLSHLPALKRLGGVEVVALCDRDEEKAARVGQRYGVAHTSETLDDVLRDDSIEAVIVATPNHLHAPMAIAALEAGKHVLVERPMARSAAEAEGMVQAARSSGRLLMCALHHRFRADTQILKKFIAGREIGRVFYTKAGWLRQRAGWNAAEWRDRKKVSGGGVLMDLGVQVLDLALYILGGPGVESVTASAHRPPQAEVEDSVSAFLRLQGGGTLTLEVTWGLLMEKDFTYVNLFGENGAALWNPLRMHRSLHGSLVNVTPEVDSVRNLYRQSIEDQLAHFVDTVRRDGNDGSAQDALHVMRLVDAIYRSADSGREVKLG